MQVPEEKQLQKRQVGFKAAISSILKGNFTKDDLSASRVSVMATLVYKSEDIYSGAIIDDGSGRIPLKNFENRAILEDADVGDAVLVIGKVREFGDEKYILPEIVKKISMGWINVRKIEFNKFEGDKAAGSSDNGKSEGFGMSKDIYEMIKKLDDGSGVAIEDLVKKSDFQDTEKIVNRLLENGDVFEIKPGKIKVLE